MDVSLNDRIDKIIDTIENRSTKVPLSVSFVYNEELNPEKNLNDLMSAKYKLTKLLCMYPIRHLSFNYIKNHNYDIEPKTLNILLQINDILRKQSNKSIQIRKRMEVDKSFDFEEVIHANDSLDMIINHINSITNNGKKLSTFEKFMYAYEYVTDFIYKEDTHYDLSESSHWIPVMNGDTIVCTGYSSLLQEICSRLFTNKEALVLENDVDVYDKYTMHLVDAHANNIIFLRDCKYKIHGLFYLDACMDSIENYDEIKGYAHCCLPLSDIQHHKIYNFDFRKVYRYSLNELYNYFFETRKATSLFYNFKLIRDFSYDDSYYKDKNSLHYFINNYEDLANQTIVPIEAFIESFRIIGQSKGFYGDELNKFVNDRINMSCKKTAYFYDYRKCKNCFSILEKDKKGPKIQ